MLRKKVSRFLRRFTALTGENEQQLREQKKYKLAGAGRVTGVAGYAG